MKDFKNNQMKGRFNMKKVVFLGTFLLTLVTGTYSIYAYNGNKEDSARLSIENGFSSKSHRQAKSSHRQARFLSGTCH